MLRRALPRPILFTLVARFRPFLLFASPRGLHLPPLALLNRKGGLPAARLVQERGRGLLLDLRAGVGWVPGVAGFGSLSAGGAVS